ncbi:hypothetical protein [Variovorax sp. GT1P44]|uniref:hypothetical protein n=1 Tax=Variovorax sp. GT1P44 TaxID=3443742 RepID=UPI003F4724A7
MPRDPLFAVFFALEDLAVRVDRDDEAEEGSACDSAFDELDAAAAFELVPDAGAGFEAQPSNASAVTAAAKPKEMKRNAVAPGGGDSMNGDVVCRRSAMPPTLCGHAARLIFRPSPESAIGQPCHTIVSVFRRNTWQQDDHAAQGCSAKSPVA